MKLLWPGGVIRIHKIWLETINKSIIVVDSNLNPFFHRVQEKIPFKKIS